MFGSLGDMMGLFGNLNKITKEYKKQMDDLKEKTVTATVGGEQVQVTANGLGEITDIKISPELVKEGDVELIEDLVLAGVNSAIEKSRELAQEQMGQLADMLPASMKNLIGSMPNIADIADTESSGGSKE